MPWDPPNVLHRQSLMLTIWERTSSIRRSVAYRNNLCKNVGLNLLKYAKSLCNFSLAIKYEIFGVPMNSSLVELCCLISRQMKFWQLLLNHLQLLLVHSALTEHARNVTSWNSEKEKGKFPKLGFLYTMLKCQWYAACIREQNQFQHSVWLFNCIIINNIG